ncbi:glycosyltransferase family 2 protein [Rhodoferax sp. PAMC 29310]|uniref:glycosyltransferase family 2 protein n=1 Tax=Rhodoferax sp. PAMC 29310 TaxID=2822760 RepID=UPI001B3273A2|nr:glycosyltransferase family 2 protein [Rhodoferax sp. PAMC 29310]
MEMIEKKPKVSVCVVTYNQEKYIRQCLQSIVDQETDFDFEVIVSDDCSTDGTRAIVQWFAEKYPGVVKPIFHEENIGAFKNFVTTHNIANCKLVSHCDGDDLFLPEKLKKQVDFFEKNLDCTVVWHRMNLFDDWGNFFPGEAGDYSMFTNGIVTFEKALRFGSVAAHSSIMYRKCARKTDHPKFDTLDLFYSWEYLSSGWGVILDNVLGEYRVNSSGSISKSSNLQIKALYAHHAGHFLKKYPKKRKDIFIFSVTNFLIDLKNRRKTSINFLWLAIKSISLISINEYISHLRKVSKLKVPILHETRQ